MEQTHPVVELCDSCELRASLFRLSRHVAELSRSIPPSRNPLGRMTDEAGFAFIVHRASFGYLHRVDVYARMRSFDVLDKL